MVSHHRWSNPGEGTSPEKKEEYARKFPWLQKFAKKNDLANFYQIQVKRAEDVLEFRQRKSGGWGEFFLVAECGHILHHVSRRANPKTPTFLQKWFPERFPYDETVAVDETLEQACELYGSCRYVVRLHAVGRSFMMDIYKSPKTFGSFRELFEVVRQQERERHAELCRIAREEIELELAQ